MKANKKLNKKVVLVIGIIFVGILTFIIYQSYALFKTNKKMNFINAKVGEFGPNGDLTVAVYIDGEKSNDFPASDSGYIFDKGECTKSGIVTWNSDTRKLSVSDITEATLCNIYFIKSPEGINAIKVKKDANMIPIMWDGTKWVKADETNENETHKWYDYENLQWANIVLVKETGTKTREEYKTSVAGTAINESDILAYYVYVPRYKYQLWNAQNGNSNPQEIKIEFQTIDDPKESGTTNGTWLTHPTFTFGTKELNGIWVGKFETSADTATTCYTAPSEANCDKANGTILPRIKPNVDSWRYINLGRMFDVSKYFQNNSIYGISASTLDSHLMKNMEWGAVAYLSHSKYGKWGNVDYVGANKEIYINNVKGASASRTVTGCSGGSPSAGQVASCPVANTYEKSGIGTGASTTGTIYGVYDMSGGVFEYTMGNMRNDSNQFYPGTAVFSTTPESKYYDSYAYDASSYTTHGRGLLGDATKETLVTFGGGTSHSWYSDYSFFLYSTYTWFIRGGDVTHGASAGAFSFLRSTGGAGDSTGFRSVLVG